jgi:hypothetical protein
MPRIVANAQIYLLTLTSYLLMNGGENNPTDSLPFDNARCCVLVPETVVVDSEEL